MVLKVLATGYCGLDCHNLWLKNVDERVRLRRKQLITSMSRTWKSCRGEDNSVEEL